MNHRTRSHVAGSLVLLAALAPNIAGAQLRPLAEFRVGVGYSDNITRNLDAVAISTGWTEAGLTGEFDWTTPRIDTHLVADATYRRYTLGSVDPEVIGGANAHVGVRLIEKHLTWSVDDAYGQSLINSFAPDAPGNRQGTNFFSTGPDLEIPLGARTAAFAGARWGSTTYESQIIDSTRRTFSGGLKRQVSALTTLSLRFATTRVTFDDEVLNPPVRARDMSAVLHREGARSTIDLEAGRTRIDFLGRNDSALLFRGTLLLRLSQTSTLTVNGGSEYSDSGEFFRLQQNDVGPVGPIGPAIQAADPLRSRYANLLWLREGSRATLRLAMDVRRERRDVATVLDVDRAGVEAGVDYRLSARVDAGARLRSRRDRFVESGVRPRESSVGLQLRWTAAARVRATLSADRVHGDNGATGSSYNENRFTLLVGYLGR